MEIIFKLFSLLALYNLSSIENPYSILFVGVGGTKKIPKNFIDTFSKMINNDEYPQYFDILSDNCLCSNCLCYFYTAEI